MKLGSSDPEKPLGAVCILLLSCSAIVPVANVFQPIAIIMMGKD